MVNVTSPEEFYGFKMGEDKKLARWDKIVEYFALIDSQSERIKVVELGKSTEGNPLTLAYVSSSENLAKLDKYKEMSWDIAHPKELTDWVCAGANVGRIADTKGAQCVLFQLKVKQYGYEYMSEYLAGLPWKYPKPELRLEALLA